jgi:arylsulfatase A
MDADEAEQNNISADHPEVVNELTALLQKFVQNGRSTPGAPQPNDVEINLWKTPPQAGE